MLQSAERSGDAGALCGLFARELQRGCASLSQPPIGAIVTDRAAPEEKPGALFGGGGSATKTAASAVLLALAELPLEDVVRALHARRGAASAYAHVDIAGNPVMPPAYARVELAVERALTAERGTLATIAHAITDAFGYDD